MMSLDWIETQLGFSVLLIIVVVGVMMTMVAYCIYFERKVAAWVQNRYGPNRVGPWGLLQPVADGIKMLLKEDIIPGKVDRALFILAPGLLFTAAMIGFAVIPWGGPLEFASGRRVNVQVASLDIGVLYILAVAGLGVYGIVLGGWASNNKFSFYGGMRAAAQLLSYEVPMGLAILVVVMTSGELRLERIAAAQTGASGGCWHVLLHPLACLILIVAAFAESNRAPFDLAEAEQELVGGYHTEYSSMKFGLFFLGEYAHMITASALIVTLYFGGWELFPFSWKLGWRWLDWLNNGATWPAALARCAIVFGKVVCFLFLYMWVRWTIPRFRFDQLMRLAWKGLIPLGLALVTATGVLVYVNQPVSWYAPISEVAVLAVLWLALARLPRTITGRQPHLPPVPTRGVEA
jgi:NADH-quinone oxidoreductase subunit H